jgi:hypothetical protein
VEGNPGVGWGKGCSREGRGVKDRSNQKLGHSVVERRSFANLRVTMSLVADTLTIHQIEAEHLYKTIYVCSYSFIAFASVP